MRILVVSEGRHELALESPVADSPLVQFVLRLLGKTTAPIEFERRRVADKCVNVLQASGKSEAYEKRAVAWLRFAEQNHFDAVVIVVDRDRKPQDRAGLVVAQSNTSQTIHRAIGIAVESFDAWMLADEKSLTKIVGNKVSRQPDPESLSDSKERCRQLAEKAGLSMTQLCHAVAKAADLAILERRCPKGFAPFATKVRLL
jgi:hypothetical protein